VKSFEQLAESAYAAFFEQDQARHGAAGPHVFNWRELSPAEKARWVAAAKQLWTEFTAIH
jgi:hypothetical protein